MTWLLQPIEKQKLWSWRAGMFTDDQLDNIIDLCSTLPAETAAVLSNSNQNTQQSAIRRSTVKWIPTKTNYNWIYETLSWNVQTINKDAFNFELTHIETLQFTEYTEDQSGFYGPHLDTGETVAGYRKLSFVLQLTNPSKYEGGELVLHTSQTPTVLPKDRGKLLFFPSYILHEVKPVTKGIRHSLVGWVAGPRFK
jgi:PKHD-type hydroxylase